MVLARTSSKVTVVHRRDQFRASKVLADRVLDHPVIEVIWNTTVHEIHGKILEDPESSQDDESEDNVDLDQQQKVVKSVVLKDVSSGDTKTIECDDYCICLRLVVETKGL